MSPEMTKLNAAVLKSQYRNPARAIRPSRICARYNVSRVAKGCSSADLKRKTKLQKEILSCLETKKTRAMDFTLPESKVVEDPRVEPSPPLPMPAAVPEYISRSTYLLKPFRHRSPLETERTSHKRPYIALIQLPTPYHDAFHLQAEHCSNTPPEPAKIPISFGSVVLQLLSALLYSLIAPLLLEHQSPCGT